LVAASIFLESFIVEETIVPDGFGLAVINAGHCKETKLFN
jgi:hypothetical protein